MLARLDVAAQRDMVSVLLNTKGNGSGDNPTRLFQVYPMHDV